MNILTRIVAYYRDQPLIRTVHHHAALVVIVMATLIALRLWSPWPAPVFWPGLIWSFVLAIHFFIVRSMDVDEDWVEERADDVRRHAYDFQHIRDIYTEPKTLEAVARERRKRKEQKSDD